MMVMCNDNIVVDYDRRRLGLSNALLDTEYDNKSIEQSTAIALNMTPTYSRTSPQTSPSHF